MIFPPGLDGNIFHRRGGGYVITFFVKDSLMSYKFWDLKNPKTIQINIKDAHSISKKIIWKSVNFEGERILTAKFSDNGSLLIDIPAFTEAGILNMKSTTARTRRTR